MISKGNAFSSSPSHLSRVLDLRPRTRSCADDAIQNLLTSLSLFCAIFSHHHHSEKDTGILQFLFFSDKAAVVVGSVSLAMLFPFSGLQFSPLNNSWNWSRCVNILRVYNLLMVYGLWQYFSTLTNIGIMWQGFVLFFKILIPAFHPRILI